MSGISMTFVLIGVALGQATRRLGVEINRGVVSETGKRCQT
jgi:hypothetical protein